VNVDPDKPIQLYATPGAAPQPPQIIIKQPMQGCRCWYTWGIDARSGQWQEVRTVNPACPRHPSPTPNGQCPTCGHPVQVADVSEVCG
jgi:hypothetical protein